MSPRSARATKTRSLWGVGCAIALAIGAACGSSGGSATDTDAEADGSSTADGVTLASYTSGPDQSEPGDQSPECAEYMMCIEGVDPGSVAAAGERYGAAGSCWAADQVEADDCTQQCLDGVDRLCGGSDGDSTGGPAGPPPCSLDALAPDADSWVVGGDDPEALPVEVAEALERNCGCHLAELEAFETNTPLYYGSLRLSTWADFQANFRGRPVHVEVRERVIDSLSMPPIYFCGDEAHGSLTTEDFALFEAWLDAGAPDAPAWADSAGTSGESRS